MSDGERVRIKMACLARPLFNRTDTAKNFFRGINTGLPHYRTERRNQSNPSHLLTSMMVREFILKFRLIE